MLRIADIGENYGYGVVRIFDPWNPEIVNIDKLNNAEAAVMTVDLVCFGGGADIHPSIYKHSNVASQCGAYPSPRDIFEMVIFQYAVKHKKPMLGICRGSQFLCAMSGGALIQDVSNHALGNGHKMKTRDGDEVFMTSTHHQMMYPGAVPHELLAWTDGRSEGHYSRDQHFIDRLPDDFMHMEPEVVYFPQSNSLCVQGHPEYYKDVNAPPVEYVRDLVTQHLGVK